MKFSCELKESKKYDVVVVGGGVAGVAAAVSLARNKKKVLIIEKTLNFGGLSTIGLVNLFVPMCNGRGVQICKGMADEFLRLSYEDGWTDMDDGWRYGGEKKGRLMARFSPQIFALKLVELMRKEGVEMLIDTVLCSAITTGKHIDGIVICSKSGLEMLKADYFVDASGDSDLLHYAGVPTVDGKNYFTYIGNGITLDSMKKAVEKGKVNLAYRGYAGGGASLYGDNQPEGRRLYKGTSKEDVTEYICDNQMLLLENVVKKEANDEFDLCTLPTMPQFRTTRRLDGDYTFTEKDAYIHKEDSIASINDFDRLDFLYEVPYGCLVKTGYDNIIAAGRCASGDGYGWDILRVIPPAILTGQAAGEACSLAIDEKCPIYSVSVKKLQNKLISLGAEVHFDDGLVPEDKTAVIVHKTEGHL